MFLVMVIYFDDLSCYVEVIECYGVVMMKDIVELV